MNVFQENEMFLKTTELQTSEIEYNNCQNREKIEDNKDIENRTWEILIYGLGIIVPSWIIAYININVVKLFIIYIISITIGIIISYFISKNIEKIIKGD